MVWTPLHATVHQTLKQRKLLPSKQSVLLAFSAGQDSMCLLQILRDLQPKWQWQLAIAHCDHRWPPDSHANASHVVQLAQQWQLEHYRFIAPQVLKGEAEGRDWRYQVLNEWAQTQGFDVVVTAHTASDRAETLLHNLFRGSGRDGLQALVWQRPLSNSVQLVRPLLDVTRAQTATFCAQFQLPLWQDTMNQDLAYRRNRIRLEVLPMLRQHFNPKIDLTLAKTAELFQAETEYLEEQAQRLLNSAIVPSEQLPQGAIAALDQPIFAQGPLALQRRAIRQWLTHSLNIQPNFVQVEKTVALVQGHQGDRTDPFIANVVAEVKRPWVYLHNLQNRAL
jgi:tRNA(Ile)-lysidine synthase